MAKKENAKYFDREGAYLIPCKNNKIGVIKTIKGYFFLGGGLENGENHFNCIERECLEEAGFTAEIKSKLCSAEAYMNHPDIGYFHPIQTYYVGTLLERKSEPEETDHVLCWVEFEKLRGNMFSEMQNWTLDKLCERKKYIC